MLRNSPFFQLYLARLREFYRQPARIFWVYGFPMLLAVVLGFAFQNRPPRRSRSTWSTGPYAEPIEKAIAAHNAPLGARQGVARRSRRGDPAASHSRVAAGGRGPDSG